MLKPRFCHINSLIMAWILNHPFAAPMRPLAASLALSGGLWRLGGLSGALWRSLALSGALWRSLAVSGGLVPSIHLFERRGAIGKDLTFPTRNAFERRGPIGKDLTFPNRNAFE